MSDPIKTCKYCEGLDPAVTFERSWMKDSKFWVHALVCAPTDSFVRCLQPDLSKEHER